MNGSLLASMKHGAAWAAGFFWIFFLLSSAFAAYSALQSVWTTTTWAVLSSSEWNKMVSNFVSVDSQLSSLSSSVAGLGSLASKSAVTSAEITDGTVATADIANSAVTDEKVAAGIAPSKLASAGATSGQVLSWNWSAWSPTTWGWAAEYKAIMNAAADHVYSAFGLWGTEQRPFTQHFTNTNSNCSSSYPTYPAYPSCPTGWTSMWTRQTQGNTGICNADFNFYTYFRTSQRYCKLTW